MLVNGARTSCCIAWRRPPRSPATAQPGPSDGHGQDRSSDARSSAVGDAEVHVHRFALIGGLMAVPPTRLYQAFRTSVLVARGRRWSAFDGPATAQTAERRPRIEPKTSSVSTRSGSVFDVGVWLYALLRVSVVVGLR